MTIRFRTQLAEVDGVPMKRWQSFEARARKAASRAGLMHWRDTFLPMHFGSDANQRYGYAKRDFSYLYYRKRQLRHLSPTQFRGTTWPDRKPLIASGSLRDSLSQSTPKFSTRNKGAETVMTIPAPKYLYMWRLRTKSPGAPPNKAKELTTILPEEQRDMLEVVRAVYEEQMAKLDKKQASAARRAARRRAAEQATGYGAGA